MIKAFVATANGDNLLDKSDFQKMLDLIFSELGQLEAATGGTPADFFSLADSNSNEQVSFMELVTVFELEALRSMELRAWIAKNAHRPALSFHTLKHT